MAPVGIIDIISSIPDNRNKLLSTIYIECAPVSRFDMDFYNKLIVVPDNYPCISYMLNSSNKYDQINPNIVVNFSDYGRYLNYKTKYGNTFTHCLARVLNNHNSKILTNLIVKEHLDIRNNKKQFPLGEYLESKSDPEIIKFLLPNKNLKMGDIVPYLKNTPNVEPSIVKMIVKPSIKNQFDNNGWTLLAHYLRMNYKPNYEVIELLSPKEGDIFPEENKPEPEEPEEQEESKIERPRLRSTFNELVSLLEPSLLIDESDDIDNINNRDIDLIMNSTGVSRHRATVSYSDNSGDIVMAILSLTT